MSREAILNLLETGAGLDKEAEEDLLNMPEELHDYEDENL